VLPRLSPRARDAEITDGDAAEAWLTFGRALDDDALGHALVEAQEAARPHLTSRFEELAAEATVGPLQTQVRTTHVEW